MNPNSILALISDLYGQVTGLQQENRTLHQELQELRASTAESKAEADFQQEERARREKNTATPKPGPKTK